MPQLPRNLDLGRGISAVGKTFHSKVDEYNIHQATEILRSHIFFFKQHLTTALVKVHSDKVTGNGSPIHIREKCFFWRQCGNITLLKLQHS